MRTDALGNRFFSPADGAHGIRKGSIGSFFFFFFLIVSASEPERSTLLLGNSSSSVAEISINHYVIHPRLILDEEEL